MFNLFKEKSVSQSVFAVLYPTRIIIDTRNTSGPGAWHSTDDISILPVEIPDKQLGEAIWNHLQRSKFEEILQDLISDYRANYKKLAKFNSEKAIMIDARAVSVFRDSKEIRIEPRNNRFPVSGEKFFYGIPAAIASFERDLDAETLGREIRKGWAQCIFS